MENVFIYTEVYNCGKIGKIALESFSIYHPNIIVNIYGTQKDFEWIEKRSNYIFHDISNENNIIQNFRQGHLGTATLWAKLIKERTEKYLIHFDSDVVFRKECISDLYNGINSGYDIVGPIRNYKNNPNFRDDVRHLPDLTQTLFFAFNRELISKQIDFNTLICMCQGTCNPNGEPTIDFFDPVEFDILKNGGRILLLDQNSYGGCDEFGSRTTSKYGEINRWVDFGDKLGHFSAVGSGMNFYHNFNTIVNVPMSYINYAVERYALFCHIFYNEHIGIHIDTNKYGPCVNLSKDQWYGKN